jgi:hypothetical protein
VTGGPLFRGRTRLALAGIAAAVLLACGAGGAIAAFTATTTNPGNTFTAAASFAATSTFTGYGLVDESSAGQLVDGTWPVAFDDSILYTTSAWTNAYSASRYADFDMSSPLPSGGRVVSSASFRMKFASTGGAGSGNACFYLEVRRASTGAVLGTYGSAGSPVACSAGATQGVSTTDISAQVPNTTIANDLRIRVLGVETGSKAWKVESATVTGATTLGNFTLYPNTLTDSANGTPASTVWGPATAGDSATFQTSGWPTNFNGSRLLTLTFPAEIPAGATITSASFTHAYKSLTAGDNACWYFEVYNGATLIGTHGSTASPVSCNATGSFVTDTVSVPEIDTVAEANAAVVKIYMKISTNKGKTLHDRATLTINY